MPDPINPNPNPTGDPKPPVNNPTPDPKPGEGKDVIDFSKMSDEQLAKVLEDPRLWKTPRLAELTAAQKKVKEYEDKKAAEEQEALKKKGDFETLSKQQEDKIKDWQTRFTNAQADNAIMAEAAKVGVTDLDAAKKLVDRANIKVDENGVVTGAEEAIKQLVADKSYLIGKTNPTSVGGGTNPANPNEAVVKFKMSQVADPVFYQANRAAIAKAMATPGAIEEDRPGM